MKNRSSIGSDQAAVHVASFEGYLFRLKSSGGTLPRTRTGEPNVSRIAADSGVGDRGRFYTNPRLGELLAEASAQFSPGVAPVPDQIAEKFPATDSKGGDGKRIQRQLEAKITKLEQHISAVSAERDDLRKKVIKLEQSLARMDHTFQTGRRVAAP